MPLCNRPVPPKPARCNADANPVYRTEIHCGWHRVSPARPPEALTPDETPLAHVNVQSRRVHNVAVEVYIIMQARVVSMVYVKRVQRR